ncbi:MAG TPA: DUF4190 domain-containing protein [Acidimicrobiales bacterium]|nr:DUF4190 domain-containing protein [Acidimicrobiales bacterium]
MTNLPTPPTPLRPLPPEHQTPRGRRKTHATAIASLVLSIAWIAGIGSIVAIILGFTSQKKIKRSTGAVGGADVSTAGITLGVVGLIAAIFFWLSVLAGGNGASTITRSPSYVDGSNYATLYYANNAAESAVCAPSNVPSGDSATLWMKGCQDAWATARFAINNSPGAGLNVAN